MKRMNGRRRKPPLQSEFRLSGETWRYRRGRWHESQRYMGVAVVRVGVDWWEPRKE